MKLKVLFLFLLLIISIKSNDLLDSFSIEGFKKYLKDNGLFQIIQSIKYAYGQDVAIISCEELNKNYNGNCQKLVIDYIGNPYNILRDDDEFKFKSNETSERNKTDLFSQSENNTFQSQDSINLPFEPTKLPENKTKELLNYRETEKNLKDIIYMLDSSKKNFNLFKLKSIYDKIIERVEKNHPSSTNNFSHFLLSSIKEYIKYLN